VLSRGAGLAALPKCITRVSEGQVWASSTELDYLLDTFVRTAPTRTLSESCCRLLTAREQEVVQLVADGLGNREIAARLKLSQHTIKTTCFACSTRWVSPAGSGLCSVLLPPPPLKVYPIKPTMLI
jgi:DNA-binding NarL/FixJ family response regulator